MSIREVIEMLVKLYNFLSKYLGEYFAKSEDAPAEDEVVTF